MTNAEWKKLFSRLRTLRWLVRIKRFEASKNQGYINRTTFGEESIYIGLMTSHRQRTQFTSTMNDIGELLYKMEGSNLAIRNLILFLITDLWRVSANYPAQSQVYIDLYTKTRPVWEMFRAFPRSIDHEQIGPNIQSLDEIIDSSVKDYLPKIMMLKLAL